MPTFNEPIVVKLDDPNAVAFAVSHSGHARERIHADGTTESFDAATGLWTASSAGATVQHNGVAISNPNFIDVQTSDLVGLGLDFGLRPTVDKTSNYTALIGDYVVCDSSGGTFTVTLPGPSQVAYAKVGIYNRLGGSSLTLQVAGGTSDVFLAAGSPTSITIAPGQWVVVYYDGATTWRVVEQGMALSALDARYGGAVPTERSVQSAGSVLESMSRNSAVNVAIALTSGAMRLVLATIPAGKTLSTLTAVSGSTAAVAPTNQWMAVFRKSDGVLLSVTDDKGAAAWAANTAKSFTLATPQAGGSGGLDIAIAIMVAATTQTPSLQGANVQNAMSGLGPVLSWNAGVGLTTPTASNIAMPVTTGSGQTPFYVAGS